MKLSRSERAQAGELEAKIERLWRSFEKRKWDVVKNYRLKRIQNSEG